MKFILCVVHDDDADQVVRDLIDQGFYVTRLASTGGFLRAGNTILFSGVEDERVGALMEIVQASTRIHTQALPSHLSEQVQASRAVIFVLNLEQLKRL